MLLRWTLPFIGAGIGWMTNIIAIRLLFRPHHPVRVPLLNIKIQGLIPKRKAEMARNIGRTIEEDLLSMEDILAQLKEKDLQEDLHGRVSRLIMEKLQDRLSFVPRQIRDHLVHYLGDLLQKEVNSSLQGLVDDFSRHLAHESKLALIIEQKVQEFDLKTLEELVRDLARKELRHIEYLGALLGFLIGMIQALLFLFLYPS